MNPTPDHSRRSSRFCRTTQVSSLFLALLCLGQPIGLPAADVTAQGLLAEATLRFGKGGNPAATSEAIAKLQRALELDPKLGAAHVQLALCHRSLGHYAEALEACKEALQLNPNDPAAYDTLATCHLAAALAKPADAAGHRGAAIAALRTRVRIAPESAAALLRLAAVLRTSTDGRGEAVELCRKAVRLDSGNLEAHLELARCLQLQARTATPRAPEQFDEAVAAARAAVRLRPDSVEAHGLLVGTLQVAGRRDDVIAAARAGIEACQSVKGGRGVGLLYTSLGLTYLQAGDREAAQRVAQELRASDPSYPNRISAELARTLTAANPGGSVVAVDATGKERLITSSGEARAAVGEAKGPITLYIGGDEATAKFEAARKLSAAGNPAKAAETLRDAIRIRPDFPEAHANLGNAYVQLGRNDDALGCYRESVRIKPDFALGHYLIGIWMGQQQRQPESIDAYREAVRLAPKNADFQFNLGNSLLRLRRFDEAIAALRDCIAADPRYAKGWMSLGLTYLYAGRRDEAVAVQAKLAPLNATLAGQLQEVLDGKARLPSL